MGQQLQALAAGLAMPGPDTASNHELAPGVRFGVGLRTGWRPLADWPVLIVVGLAGTGKSTALAALAHTGLPITMLPNRRTLTDRLIIAPLQTADGTPVQRLGRMERYPYVRRYLER